MSTQAPQQPLEDLDWLKSHLRTMLAEKRVVQGVVEAIYAHGVDSDIASDTDDWAASGYHTKQADRLTNLLEKFGVTLEENEEETCAVFHKHEQWRDPKTPWLVFSRVEWEWQNDDGKFPWEADQGDDNPYVPTQWDVADDLL